MWPCLLADRQGQLPAEMQQTGARPPPPGYRSETRADSGNAKGRVSLSGPLGRDHPSAWRFIVDWRRRGWRYQALNYQRRSCRARTNIARPDYGRPPVKRALRLTCVRYLAWFGVSRTRGSFRDLSQPVGELTIAIEPQRVCRKEQTCEETGTSEELHQRSADVVHCFEPLVGTVGGVSSQGIRHTRLNSSPRRAAPPLPTTKREVSRHRSYTLIAQVPRAPASLEQRTRQT
jgi:hypothetical protein